MAEKGSSQNPFSFIGGPNIEYGTCTSVKTTDERRSLVMQQLSEWPPIHLQRIYNARYDVTHGEYGPIALSPRSCQTYGMETSALEYLQLLDDCVCVLVGFRLPSQVAGQILEASAHCLLN